MFPAPQLLVKIVHEFGSQEQVLLCEITNVIMKHKHTNKETSNLVIV